ncbi:MAG: response regulator [Herminiimonas sp.]|nr:response regulator [Herminiimonas sp.]
MSANPPHVLIVEDDPKIGALIADYIAHSGWRGTLLGDGSAALEFLRTTAVDVLILDVMLPGRSGIDVCSAVRRFSRMPIILLTARIDEADRLLGLDSGADDYVCKPFSPRELMARVRAQLRRTETPPAASPLLRVDTQAMQVFVDGSALALTPAEFRLLAEMIAHPGRVYGRDTLLNFLHDSQRSNSDRSVDSHIKNIRRKLAERLPGQDCLQSVYGVGYRFDHP